MAKPPLLEASPYTILFTFEQMKTNSEWFADWFNTPYYHLLYSHRNHSDAAEFLEGLLSTAKLPPNARILDAGCGSGRHALYLHQKDFLVTGIDLSEKNIQAASAYAEEGLEFFIHDIRNDFRINYFDAVFNLFTSFGYFENEHENIRVLSCFYNALRPGGLLSIDYLNPGFVSKNADSNGSKTIEGIDFSWEKKILGRFVEKHILVKDKNQTYSYSEKVELINHNQFTDYLTTIGFEQIRFFGDSQFNEYHPEHSPRQIIFATKSNR